MFVSARVFKVANSRSLRPLSFVLASQDQTLVVAGLAFSPTSDEHERSSSPGHGHFLCLLQKNFLFY